ncbi:MAG: hypothetical protein SFX73_33150 [Kofleriaceae bacterium]|nr:hypothetical protein [Kofleriaceae bacterium]
MKCQRCHVLHRTNRGVHLHVAVAVPVKVHVADQVNVNERDP